MFATGSKKVIFNQKVSENLCQLCPECLGDAAHPAHGFWEPLGFRPLHHAPQRKSYSIVLSRGWGKFNEGGPWSDLWCSVLSGTVALSATGKSINHTVHPLWTDLNVTGPHAVVLNVSFHWWCGRVFGKPICKTSLCLRCEEFTDNLYCLAIWVMRLTMTYSRMYLSVRPQLPPALPRDRWNCGELLRKWPSRQGGGRKDFWADGRSLPVNNWFILGHNTLDLFTQCPYYHFCEIHWWSSDTNWMNLC